MYLHILPTQGDSLAPFGRVYHDTHGHLIQINPESLPSSTVILLHPFQGSDGHLSNDSALAWTDLFHCLGAPNNALTPWNVVNERAKRIIGGTNRMG